MINALSCSAAVFALFLASPVLANEDDHVATEETVGISVGGFTADSDGSGNYVLPVSITNSAAVALVLRGIETPGGAALKVLKGRKVFGSQVWSEPQFMQINPSKTLSLSPPTYKVVVPASFAEGSGAKGFKLDFGPKGAVWHVMK